MASAKLRTAVGGDIERMMEIQHTSAGASPWDAAAYRGFLSALEGLSGGWVALEGNRVVGFLVFRRPVPDELEILNLAVDPALRRRGIGTELVRHSLVEHRGYVFLEVRSKNRGAEAFYRTLGFEEAGQRTDYYRDPSDDALVMALGP